MAKNNSNTMELDSILAEARSRKGGSSAQKAPARGGKGGSPAQKAPAHNGQAPARKAAPAKQQRSFNDIKLAFLILPVLFNILPYPFLYSGMNQRIQ